MKDNSDSHYFILKKQVLNRFMLILTLSACLTPLLVTPTSAAECGGVDTTLIECTSDSSDGGTIREVIITVVNILTIGAGILGVIGISVAGIQYLTAGGNEQQIAKAKSRIFNVVLGIAVFVGLFGILKWFLQGELLGDIEVQSVKISQRNVNLGIGDTKSLNVSVFPLDASKDNITYSSDNANVATVDSSGKINAKSPGTATITATTPNGKTASVSVKVEKPPEEVKKENCSTIEGNEITWIGDSYSVGAQDVIKAKYPSISFGSSIDDPNSTIQGCKFVGEPTPCHAKPTNPSALDVLQKTIDEGNLKPYLVMAVGTNGGWNSSYVERFKSIIARAPDTKVIFVESRSRNADYASSNVILKSLVDSNKNYTLANWTSAYDPSYFPVNDGIHPAINGGYDKWVSVIAEAVTKACSEK